MAISEYRDFTLIADDVKKDDNDLLHFEVRVPKSPAGESGPTPRQIPRDLWTELGRLERGELSVDGIIRLGETLTELLLPDDARELFVRSLDRLDPGQGLRLRLHLDPALANIPWEFMYIQRARGEKDVMDFLALKPQISIARHEGMGIPGDFDATPRRRRLLVAMASPEDELPLDLDKEREYLQEALRDVPGIDLDFLKNATIQGFSDKLQRDADIFHFAGHGTSEGKGAIVFVTEDGRSEKMPAEQLGVNLCGRGVQLAVLGACETGRREGQNVWSGVVAALMKAGIPAAVAMQYDIWDDAAIKFNRSFYQALAAGFPLDYAVSAGRLAAFNQCYPVREDPELGKCYRDWGVPVLYLRSEQDFVLPAITDATEREAVAVKVDRDITLITKPDESWWSRHRRLVFSALAAAAGTTAVVAVLFALKVVPWPLREKESEPVPTAETASTVAPETVVVGVPDVVGWTVTEAEEKLDASGFEVKNAGDREGKITSQRPGVGTKLDPQEGYWETRLVKEAYSKTEVIEPARTERVKVPGHWEEPERRRTGVFSKWVEDGYETKKIRAKTKKVPVPAECEVVWVEND